MENIQKEIDIDEELTIITVSGKITAEQVINILEDYYSSNPTLNLLLDFSKGLLEYANMQDIEEIISVAKKFAPKRVGGKTAVVTSRTVDFGIARMYEIMSEIKGHTIQHHMFMDFEEALKWINQ